MSTTDKIIIKLLRSSGVIDDSSSIMSRDFDGQRHPKVPDLSELDYGEVALNIAKNYEMIGIKNNNNEFSYIPFNITKRVLLCENNVSDLSGLTTTSINELSAYTRSVSGNLYTYTTQQYNQLSNQLNNLELDEISDVTIVEHDQTYTPLDKEEYHEKCYIQVNSGDTVIILNGNWVQNSNELIWDIIDYKIGVNTPSGYAPNMKQKAIAKTHDSQLVTLSYVAQNGQTVTMHEEPTERHCKEFNILFSTYGTVSNQASHMDLNKISLTDAYNPQMRYVYIEEFPDDIQVFFYQNQNSLPNKCSKFQNFDNIWEFNGTLTENSSISLYSPSLLNEQSLDLEICGDVSEGQAQIATISLCYGSLSGGITSILTSENPAMVFEVLAKSGYTWTNQIIGMGSKTQHGIVKVGDNINVNDGVIDINVDQEAISGSTNPIAGGVVYDISKSMEVLTNEEMDILLGGPLPVYLMDDNGEMILDQDGNLIELI